jgi:geranylgeranyl pyrophosphate synthase
LARLHGLLGRALLSMSEGQRRVSGRLAKGRPTPGGARRAIELYAGAQLGLYAQAGAVAAGAEPAVGEAYAAFGQALGAANQISSDLGELCSSPPIHDLVTGKLSVTIAHALSALPDQEQERLRLLLDAVAVDVDSHGEVQALLQAAGSIQYTALIVEVYRQRALAALERAAPMGDSGGRLYALADDLSLLRAR